MAIEKIKPLTKKQLETLKKRLEEEKQGLILNQKIDFDMFGLASEDSGDEIDQAIADYNGSHLLRFRNREIFYAKKVDKSLKKLIKNEYGLCVECGCQIKFERLMARPTADMCILCKEDAERDENHNFFGRQSKSLAKTIDFVGMTGH